MIIMRSVAQWRSLLCVTICGVLCGIIEGAREVSSNSSTSHELLSISSVCPAYKESHACDAVDMSAMGGHGTDTSPRVVVVPGIVHHVHVLQFQIEALRMDYSHFYHEHQHGRITKRLRALTCWPLPEAGRVTYDPNHENHCAYAYYMRYMADM